MRYLLISATLLLTGCDAIRSTSDRLFGEAEPQPQPVAEVTAPEPEAVPASVVEGGWTGARTTVAGLGDPNTPGRWLQTPLVEAEINGRVVVKKTGAQAYVTLIPAPGAEGSGSRLSLDAMRALLLPFDELVELDVYTD